MRHNGKRRHENGKFVSLAQSLQTIIIFFLIVKCLLLYCLERCVCIYIVSINDVFNYLRTVLWDCLFSIEVKWLKYIYYILLLSYWSLCIGVPKLCGTFISVSSLSQKNYLYIILIQTQLYCTNVLLITTTWYSPTNNFTIPTSRTKINDMYFWWRYG